MKYICLDTETTGFITKTDRIIEIGCVNITNGLQNKTTYQQYINPSRSVPESAQLIHGITTEFLQDYKTFEHYVDEFLNFIQDATLIIHNASFDVRFLNAELEKIQRPPLTNPIIDTLKIAKVKFPNKKISLDALKEVYNIKIMRNKHGALLDAEILAHVYLEMQKQQSSLNLESTPQETAQTQHVSKARIQITTEELKENEKFFNE